MWGDFMALDPIDSTQDIHANMTFDKTLADYTENRTFVNNYVDKFNTLVNGSYESKVDSQMALFDYNNDALFKNCQLELLKISSEIGILNDDLKKYWEQSSNGALKKDTNEYNTEKSMFESKYGNK